MKKKYKGYLVTYSDINQIEYKEIKRKYLGETYAISELKAINNFRYRIGKPSYSKMYNNRGYADTSIDYNIEVFEV